MTYFGFAVAHSMFRTFDNTNSIITRSPISIKEIKEKLLEGELQSFCKPINRATIEAINKKFNLNIPTLKRPVFIELGPLDSVIVVSVDNLPRLEKEGEYNNEEICNAQFSFVIYTVL